MRRLRCDRCSALSVLLFLSLLFFLVCVPLLLGAASRRCLAALRPGRSVLDGISRVQPMFVYVFVSSSYRRAECAVNYSWASC